MIFLLTLMLNAHFHNLYEITIHDLEMEQFIDLKYFKHKEEEMKQLINS